MKRISRTCSALAVVLFACAFGLLSGFGRAHDGAHSPHVLMHVDRAVVTGNEVALDITFTGLRPGFILPVYALAAHGANVMRLDPPLEVRFAKDITLSTRLRFVDSTPDMFTLTVDFGASGQGHLVVVPGQMGIARTLGRGKR